MVHVTLFAMLNLLYFYISTFRSVCAVPSMAVFCSSLISWFPGMLLRYFLNYFEMVPVITGIIIHFMFDICYISKHKSFYYLLSCIFLALLFVGTATSLILIWHIFYTYWHSFTATDTCLIWHIFTGTDTCLIWYSFTATDTCLIWHSFTATDTCLIWHSFTATDTCFTATNTFPFCSQ